MTTPSIRINHETGCFNLFACGSLVGVLDAPLQAVKLGHRPRVCMVNGPSFYDTDTLEYQHFLHQSKIGESGYLRGLEFLLYLPKTKQVVTFYCCMNSLRPLSECMALGYGLFQLNLTVIATKFHRWYEAKRYFVKDFKGDITIPDDINFTEWYQT